MLLFAIYHLCHIYKVVFFTTKMFSQGSLLLIVAVGLVTSVSQPIKWAKSLIFPEVPILNPLPKVVQDISNVPGVTLQKNGLTGLWFSK